MAAQYDIELQRGETFKFFAELTDNDGEPFNFTDYTAEMMVRKSPASEKLVLKITGANMIDSGVPAGAAVTGGGSAGIFDPRDGGVSGVGWIKLNAYRDGSPGNTGGILIEFDKDTSRNIRAGINFYDMFVDVDGASEKLIAGRFNVVESITR